MEPEDSLPCSHQPATGLCPERDASSTLSLHHISLRPILLLFSPIQLGLASGPSLRVFQLKFCMYFSCPLLPGCTKEREENFVWV